MQVPKRAKGLRKLKTKICQEPGCGKEFLGHPIAKYCDVHRDPRKRRRQRKKVENVDVKNMVFDHAFTRSTVLEFVCALEGCENRFKILALPKQDIYPKYCEEHRSEFRRQDFLRRRRLAIHC